jgi:hypothetical protein
VVGWVARNHPSSVHLFQAHREHYVLFIVPAGATQAETCVTASPQWRGPCKRGGDTQEPFCLLVLRGLIHISHSLSKMKQTQNRRGCFYALGME